MRPVCELIFVTPFRTVPEHEPFPLFFLPTALLKNCKWNKKGFEYKGPRPQENPPSRRSRREIIEKCADLQLGWTSESDDDELDE